MLEENFFVYRHIRLDKGTPFYIGKGKGERISHHTGKVKGRDRNYRKHNKINKIILETNTRPYALKVLDNIYEFEAFEFEVQYIKEIGRLDIKTGLLVNASNGGEGPAGKVNSIETRNKIKETMRKNGSVVGTKNPFYGKTHSKESRLKISKAGVGRKRSQSALLNSSNAMKSYWKDSQYRLKTGNTISKSLYSQYEVIDPLGNIYNVCGLKPFCKIHNLNNSSMCAVATGRKQHHRNWKCKKIIE